jgi:hypothetical protein
MQKQEQCLAYIEASNIVLYYSIIVNSSKKSKQLQNITSHFGFVLVLTLGGDLAVSVFTLDKSPWIPRECS